MNSVKNCVKTGKTTDKMIEVLPGLAAVGKHADNRLLNQQL